MKKLLLVSFILIAFGCKKDAVAPDTPKAFTYISLDDITANETKMSSSSTENIIVFSGFVLVYKTNKGVYGKVRFKDIDTINKNVTLDLVNYNPDGTNALSDPFKYISGSPGFFCDLDIFTKTASDDLAADFSCQFSGANMLVKPINGAKFYLYSE